MPLLKIILTTPLTVKSSLAIKAMTTLPVAEEVMFIFTIKEMEKTQLMRRERVAMPDAQT